MESYDLIKIKDKYGEKMMHLCRELFPTLLDKEGILFNTLSNNFYYSKNLYDDLIKNDKVASFQNYIYSKVKGRHRLKESNKTPEELLKKVGYTLYKCETMDDLKQFEKYYAPQEKLCTFNSDKLSRYYIFFAVRDNASNLNRNDFTNPSREDEYGTSVISIQFMKGFSNPVSIKNRYNHSVYNPDATFYNNLENIILGLTKSFEITYDLNIFNIYIDELNIPNYVKAKDGRYYRYNYHINNVYYCSDNIIIANYNVIKYYAEKEKYLLADYFIIDMENKTISLYDESIWDSFTDCFHNIQKIEVFNDKDKKLKYIYVTQKENIITIVINKYNKIVAYYNEYELDINDNFLIHNKSIKEISLSSVRYIGNNFLSYNDTLERIYMPMVKTVGDYFLYCNKTLSELHAPNLKYVGNGYLYKNEILKDKSKVRKKIINKHKRR